MDAVIIFVTDFADQAVALPMILAIAFALLVQGWARGAGAWVGAMVATFGTVLVAKLVSLTCTFWLSGTGIVSPSGHAASATLLGGGLAATFGAGAVLSVLAGVMAGALIGATRLYLHVHTIPEVVLGVALGALGAALLWNLAGPPPTRPRALSLGIAALAVVVALHGRHMPAEPAIREAAGLLRQMLPICQPRYAETTTTCRPT